jgi:hypothetical protein
MGLFGIENRGYGRGTIFLALSLGIMLVFQGCKPGLDKATSFKTVFHHYREQESIVAISFPPGLVGLFLNENDAGQSELKQLFQDLSTFRMLSCGQGLQDAEPAEELRKTVIEFTGRNDFSDLFRLQTSDEDLFIRILEKDGTIREAILMLGSENSFFVIDLTGNIDPAFFKRLAEGGQLQSLINLADLNI